MKNFRIILVEDWQHFYKWSSVRFSAAFAALIMVAPHLLSLLSDHWPDLAPYAAHLFPNQDATLWPAVGAAITILARITEIHHGEPQQ